jgi:hypothetical protein
MNFFTLYPSVSQTSFQALVSELLHSFQFKVRNPERLDIHGPHLFEKSPTLSSFWVEITTSLQQPRTCPYFLDLEKQVNILPLIEKASSLTFEVLQGKPLDKETLALCHDILDQWREIVKIRSIPFIRRMCSTSVNKYMMQTRQGECLPPGLPPVIEALILAYNLSIPFISIDKEHILESLQPVKPLARLERAWWWTESICVEKDMTCWGYFHHVYDISYWIEKKNLIYAQIIEWKSRRNVVKLGLVVLLESKSNDKYKKRYKEALFCPVDQEIMFDLSCYLMEQMTRRFVSLST